jgi:heat shock protein HslJ
MTACGSNNVDDSGTASVPHLSELANATYTGIYEEPVKLTNGRWEGKPFPGGGASRPSVSLVRDFYKTGDLAGDGKVEAVVMLAESSGGSGTFQYLAVVGRSGGEMTNLGTARVGDRVQIIRAWIENGSILMDVVQAGPDDAMCCPTQVTHRTWQLRSGTLKEVSARATGRLSLKIIEGTEWVLTRFNWNDPAPAEPEVTLTFAEGKAAGSGGCNRYFGGVEETAPGEISFGQIGATRMICSDEVMALESRYHKALEGVTGYSFVAEQLALSYLEDGAYKTMLFRRR